MSISSARQIKRLLNQDALVKALVEFIEITPQATVKALPGVAIFIAEYPYILEFEAVWDLKVVGLSGDDLETVLQVIQAKLGGVYSDNLFQIKTFATDDLIELAQTGAEQIKREQQLTAAVAKIQAVRDGRDGARGDKGEPGERGPVGPAGPPGRNGRDGQDGRDLVATEASLNDLKDVYVDNVKRGNVLMYDGNNWVARFIEQRLGNNASLTQEELSLFKGLSEAGEPMGHVDRFGSTIAFDEPTRTFTITPVGDEYVVWVKAKRFVITEPLSVQIPDTTGLYFIFFDVNGQLDYQTDYFYWDSEAPTAYVYWDADANICPYLADERHGIVLDWQTHEYLHRTRGSSFANGFAILNYTIDGDNSLDSSAQFDLNGGTFFDEDLQIDISHSETPDPTLFQQDLQGPAKCDVFYKIGSVWKLDSATNFAFKMGPTRPYYNLLTGSIWSLAETDNNRFVNYYIIATNNIKAPIISLMGQQEHVNIADAQNEDFGALDLQGFPSKEFRFLYKIILRTGNFTNSVDAIIAGVQDLRTYSGQFVAAVDAGAFATAAQGALADTAIQPGDDTYLTRLAIGLTSAATNTDLDVNGAYAGNIVAIPALTIDCSAGNYFTKTINGASTFVVSNVPASRAYSFILELTHTSGAVTWFSGVEWPGGTAPTLVTGRTHLFLFITDDGGSRWRASSLVNYSN